MITRRDLRDRAGRLWSRKGREWAVGDTSTAALDIPLHPPTERQAMSDLKAAQDWVASWRDFPGVTWETRRWSRVGEQQIPVRVTVLGPEEITRLAGVGAQWQTWRERAELLLSELGEDVRAAIFTHMRAIGGIGEDDFARMNAAVAWLREHPTSGYFVRELPIRGIDSKWLERHLRVVTALVGADDLGLRRPPVLVRVRFLHPDLPDVTAPVQDLDRLQPPAGSRVLIVENLQTFLAVPASAGLVVVAGQGDAVDVLAGIGWARRAHYWGDLDSHGFRILSKGRKAGLELASTLMDVETLDEFRDLTVVEPKPATGIIARLTEGEERALLALRAGGDLRLEQERIAWEWALQHLP